jgi:hypothetical protein
MMLKAKNKIKIIISIIILLGLVAPRCSQAYSWPDIIGNMFGASYGELLQEMQKAIVDALKQAAAKTSDAVIRNVIGGASGGPLFITDWNKTLITDPYSNTNVIVNDLLTSSYSGRNSSLYSYGSSSLSFDPSNSYDLQPGEKSIQSDSLLAEGVGGNYLNNIAQQAKNNDILSNGFPQPDIQNYTNDTSQLFANGWTAPIKFFGNPANSEMGLEISLNMVELNILQQQQLSAQTQAISNQGYKAVMKNGIVVTPGATIAAIQANAEDLPNKILAGASSIPGVAVALVTRLITKTVTQGIWDVQEKAETEINNSGSSAPQEIFKPSY